MTLSILRDIHATLLFSISAVCLLLYIYLEAFETYPCDVCAQIEYFEFPDEIKGFLPRKLPSKRQFLINLWNFGFKQDFNKETAINGFRCTFTANRDKQNESDVMLLDFPLSDTWRLQRSNQLWLLHFMRTPITLQQHQKHLCASDFMYGYEAIVSYRKSYGIHSPFAKFIPENKKTNEIQLTAYQLNNVASIRVKYRQQYTNSSPFEELRSFLNASMIECETEKCFKEMSEMYAFVLLEFNDYCEEFIPIEMYYLMAYKMVPIVFSNAAMREQMPLSSFIDLNNIESFDQVRSLLVAAWKHSDAMQLFHKWRHDYELILLYSYDMRFTEEWFPNFCESLITSNSSLQEISENVVHWFYDDEKCFEWNTINTAFVQKEFDSETCPDVNTEYEKAIIPNIVHFVRFQNSIIDFPFYIVLKSVLKVEHTLVLIHTDKRLTGDYWNELSNNYTNIYALPIDLAVFANRPFSGKFRDWSLSDFYRIYVLLKYGGTSLHDDHILLRPLHSYRFYESTTRYSLSYEEMTPELLIANRKARILHHIWNMITNEETIEWETLGAVYSKLYEKGVTVSRLVHHYSESFTNCEPTIQWLFNYTAVNEEWMSEAGVHLCRAVIDGVLGDKYGQYKAIQKQIYSLDIETVKTYDTTFGRITRYILYNETDIIN